MRLVSYITSIFIFSLFFFNFSYAVGNIEFLYLQDLTILQGERSLTRVVLENKGNETIEWAELKSSAPSGIQIDTGEKIIDFLYPSNKISFNFNIIVDSSVTPGINEIKLWVEEDGSSLGEYTFNLTVEENPNLVITTTSTTSTTLEETTTSTTTTIQETTTTITKVEKTKNNMISKSVVIVIIVVVIIVLSVILFNLFLKSTKENIQEPQYLKDINKSLHIFLK